MHVTHTPAPAVATAYMQGWWYPEARSVCPLHPEGCGHHTPAAPEVGPRMSPSMEPPPSSFPAHGSRRDRPPGDPRSHTQHRLTAPLQRDGKHRKHGAQNTAGLWPLSETAQANTGTCERRFTCNTWHDTIKNGGGKRGACFVTSAHSLQAWEVIRYTVQFFKRSWTCT